MLRTTPERLIYLAGNKDANLETVLQKFYGEADVIALDRFRKWRYDVKKYHSPCYIEVVGCKKKKLHERGFVLHNFPEELSMFSGQKTFSCKTVLKDSGCVDYIAGDGTIFRIIQSSDDFATVTVVTS